MVLSPSQRLTRALFFRCFLFFAPRTAAAGANRMEAACRAWQRQKRAHSLSLVWGTQNTRTCRKVKQDEEKGAFEGDPSALKAKKKKGFEILCC